MLSFPAAIKVCLCTVACGVRWRRSFDGLSMMAEHSSFTTCSIHTSSYARGYAAAVGRPWCEQRQRARETSDGSDFHGCPLKRRRTAKSGVLEGK
jgi:hypothetical protein